MVEGVRAIVVPLRKRPGDRANPLQTIVGKGKELADMFEEIGSARTKSGWWKRSALRV
jgi:hypothetical protein